ncbi:MAG TPA: hypothetical protein VEI03_06595 [Stellaceae bacterium]|nr:hypothetical protein [Stellaceae bacterium]
MRRSPPAPLLLLTLCLALGILLYREIAAPAPHFTPDGAAASPAATPARPADFIAPPPQQFAETETRPLFVASRRPVVAAPPPAAAAPKAPAPPSPPSLTLVGIIASAEERIALIKPANSTEILKAGEGETVSGWQIRRIFADHIVVATGANEQEIAFPPQRDTGNAPGAAAAGSPLPAELLIRPARRP